MADAATDPPSLTIEFADFADLVDLTDAVARETLPFIDTEDLVTEEATTDPLSLTVKSIDLSDFFERIDIIDLKDLLVF